MWGISGKRGGDLGAILTQYSTRWIATDSSFLWIMDVHPSQILFHFPMEKKDRPHLRQGRYIPSKAGIPVWPLAMLSSCRILFFCERVRFFIEGTPAR